MPDCDSPDSPSAPAVSREQMRHVLDVARSLAVVTDLDRLLLHIARAATAMLGCERASVFLHDPRTAELWTTVALQSEPIRIPVNTGIVGMAFRENRVIHCADAYADARFNAEPDRLSGFVTRNLLAAPLLDLDGSPVGAMQAINKIGGAFTEADASLLRLLSDQAGVAIQRYNLQQQALASVRLQRELELAHKVQEATIPRCPPSLPGLQCAGWTRAASTNGGDCYDLWGCGDRLGILLADASGHGMGSALIVSQVRALVRVLCQTERDPFRILLRINERLAADLEPGRFATAFLGFLELDGTLSWCSAGHGPTLICRNDGRIERLDATRPPLCWMEGLDDAAPAPTTLAPGESLLVLSDGVTEAFNAREELFGVERVIEAVGARPPEDAAAAIAAIRRALVAWQSREEPHDDQTAVIILRQPSAAQESITAVS